MSYSVTLFICTSGRPELLARCLESVVAGAELPRELVVVNGEDGLTPAVVGRFADRFDQVILVRHPNRNLATLRNIGLPFTTGDIVAMTDDDAIVDSGWIAALRSAHEQFDDAGGIGGPVSGVSDSFVSRVADAVVFPVPKAGQTIDTLPTVNMSYKRAALAKIGPFDESLFRGEDVDYNWRLVHAGYRIRFEPSMRVRHEHRTTLFGLYQQQWMYGRAYVLVRRKWPEMYSVFPHSLKRSRSWLKLAWAAAAVVVQPWGLSRVFSDPGDRARAYLVLVVHHLVWKLGMLRQALGEQFVREIHRPQVHELKIDRWRAGQPDEAQVNRDSPVADS